MKKKDGFPGQLNYVIPDRILSQITNLPLCENLYLTDIGYYPNAKHHFRERPKGIEQCILIYNVAGCGILKIQNEEILIPEDHFVIIPSIMPHAYYSDSKEPWSIYWIHFAGEKAKYFTSRTVQAIPIQRSKTSRINERIHLFDEIFNNLERGYSVEIMEYVNLCLPRLLATFTHISQYRLVNEQFTKDPVTQGINFMLENIRQKLKLEAIAQSVKLSTSHFSRLFISRTGYSPIEYFIHLRIQRTCRLLDNHSLTIADVARETGFDDPFYFSRQFRKVMNMSPMQYRKRL